MYGETFYGRHTAQHQLVSLGDSTGTLLSLQYLLVAPMIP